MEPSAPSALQIAGHRVHPGLNRVETATGHVTLEPKVMGVLACLAGRPGEVVTKEELLARVWPDVFVTEDVLVRAVGELRRVFADEAGAPAVIETIRKRGYRLVADVTPVADPSRGAPRSSRVRPRVAGAVALAALAAASLTAAWLSSPAHRASHRPALRFVPLGDGSGAERDPAVSPDGTRVAFAWNGGAGEDTDLYVQLVGDEARLRLTRGPARDRAPVWSPDGTQLAFARLEGEGCDVMRVSALGGSERRLARCADPHHVRMDWSPDGRWLALSQRTGQGASPFGLQLLDVETLERRALTLPPPEIHGDELPAFSPDGRELAFVRFVGPSSGDLHRVAVGGGEPERLTTDNVDITGLDWVEEGRAVVISSDRAGLYSLWRVPIGSGDPVLLAGGASRMKHPSASRDGAVIAYESWRYAIGIYEHPLRDEAGDEAPGRRLIGGGDRWNFDPRLSPDGSRLAFASTRSGSYEIWTAGADGANERRLTSFGSGLVGHPRWSPDGRQIAFVARPEGHADIYRVGADGGPPLRLTTHPLDELAPEWAGDGRALYFSSRRTGEWEIFRLSLETGEERRMTRDGGLAATESPDRRSLLFTRVDRAGLWERPLAGGEAVPIVSDLPPGRWTDWVAAPEGLYYRGEGVDLLYSPWPAGPARVVAHLAEQTWPGFDIRADGGVLYSRADRRECDIALITNAD
jgi:Tol biopolymer transport system component/DNA-binding winged helix-turn-helix (wHTH) protein